MAEPALRGVLGLREFEGLSFEPGVSDVHRLRRVPRRPAGGARRWARPSRASTGANGRAKADRRRRHDRSGRDDPQWRVSLSQSRRRREARRSRLLRVAGVPAFGWSSRRRAASRRSPSPTMLYRSNTLRVLWPLSFMAARSGTPARTMFRIAVRRTSCGILPGELKCPPRQATNNNDCGSLLPDPTRRVLQNCWRHMKGFRRRHS